MSNNPTKYNDVIDSRDVIARIEELEAMEAEEISADEKEELAALKAFAEEGEKYAPDWKYGEAIIRYSYFETYAQELADDCGMIPDGLAWPCTCIDWERAARELQQDYTQIDFDGVAYWIR